MKKSLIALAALATVGAAQAQSSVTVYGILDAGYVSSTNNIAGGVKTEKDTITGGVSATNRLGFRGVEDIGGGSRAGFVAEAGLGSLTTSSNNNAFMSTSQTSGNRQTFVYVENNKLGKLNLGYMLTATHLTRLSADPTGGANMPGNLAVAVGMPGTASAATLANNGVETVAVDGATTGSTLTNADYTLRTNQISYESPRINGFQVGVGISANKNEATDAASSNALTQRSTSGISYNINYAAGKAAFAATFSDGSIKSGATTSIVDDTRENTSVAGSYDFGIVRLSAVYFKDQMKRQNSTTAALTTGLGNVKNEGAQVSAIAPIAGTKLRVFATYAEGDYTAGSTAAKRDTKGMQAGAYYDLSKRTTAYALYGKQERENVARTATNKDDAIAFGLRHSF